MGLKEIVNKDLPKSNPNIEEYVWYVSYGSNISKTRFLCYIKGDKPKGSKKTEKGCRDPSMPKFDKLTSIEQPLYFAKSSQRWSGGVAFIGLKKTKKEITLGRMYLIKKSQFVDIVRQENDDEYLNIDFDKVINQSSLKISESKYGNIIYLGKELNIPKFTFTSPKDILNVKFNPPSKEYLRMIASGLKEAYKFPKEKLAGYFIEKSGVKGNYTNENLLKIFSDLSS